MFKIEDVVLQRELKYKGTVVLTYKITYPKIVSNTYNYSIEQFNRFNRIRALKLKLYAEKDLFLGAKEQYDYDTINGYPVMVYELILDYTTTYNDNYIISLYSDEYVFTGGAHGSTVRSSQNWNMKQGIQFGLDYLFPNGCEYLLLILKDINHQIEEQIEDGSNQYFEDYCKLVLDTFEFNQFYLTDNFITIYFQQYDIAPYSSGIPTFNIAR